MGRKTKTSMETTETTEEAPASAAPAAPTPAAAGLWKRYLAPYYICNAVALLVYLPIRYLFSSEELQDRNNYLGIPLEHEIFLLAALSWVINYRKKATSDGVVALFFMYGKVGVLAALYYLDMTLFGWYAAYCVVLFAGVGLPVYSGPSKIRVLNPALVERLIKRAKKPAARNWLVYFYAEWSDYCLEHDAMMAELSLTYSSESLQFGKVDLNQWTDLATEYNIDVSATSWQLPTLILFQDGKEAVRLPQFDAKDKIIKTVLHRPGIVAVFRLNELKEGKAADFKAKSA